VAIDPSGSATAVWIEKAADTAGTGIAGTTVWASRSTAGSNAWSTPVRISDGPTADYTFFAYLPDIAVDHLGNAIAVWEQDDPATTARTIWTSRYDGSSWSTPYQMSSGTKHCEDPHVDVDGSGNVFSIWTQNTNTYDAAQPAWHNSVTNTWAAVYSSASATWGAPGLVGDPDVGLVAGDGTGRARIAVNAAGAAVVAWHQTKDNIRAIVSNRFDPATDSWLTPQSLTTGTLPLDRPAVAIDPDGNAFAAWLDYGGDGPKNGWRSRYDALEGTWSQAGLFETSDTADVEELAIDTDASGNALLVWQTSEPGVGSRIQAIRYTSEGWSAPTQVGAGNRIDMDVNSNGDALFVSVQRGVDPWTGFYEAPYAARYHP
jgi:hypothetical protein